MSDLFNSADYINYILIRNSLENTTITKIFVKHNLNKIINN